MVFFGAGGIRFAVEASQVVGMLPASSIPTSFAHLMGMAPVESKNRVLALRVGDTVQSFLVEEPVVTRNVSYESIYPLPKLMSSRISLPHIRALMWEEGVLTILAALQADASTA
jgi:hypothetical protein